MTPVFQHIHHYLHQAKLMQICTSVQDRPWCASVWFAADDHLQLYWISKSSRRHSKELMQNNCVAGTIVMPQTPEDIPSAIQFEGTGQRVVDKKEIERAREIYIGRIFSKEQVDTFTHPAVDAHEWYVVRPKRFVLFDMVHFPDSPQQEHIV
jgi:uncharacterized protein YhbP (UPF0306 family)